jgi:hypothetical protein
MKFNVPSKVRAGLYVFTALATPVVGYLFAKEIIGELELTLWAAEVTAVNIMAGFNTNVTENK